MEAVLDVYQRRYDPEHPLLCLDESPKQLISEVRSPLTTAHGTTLVDYEYYREGSVTCIWSVSRWPVVAMLSFAIHTPAWIGPP
ncbi:MAG: hypothetical protein HS126_19375 [Anaerolineales bacterium]|nr:hypothetical protein [Anaerolineales bacterium]